MNKDKMKESCNRRDIYNRKDKYIKIKKQSQRERERARDGTKSKNFKLS